MAKTKTQNNTKRGRPEGDNRDEEYYSASEEETAPKPEVVYTKSDFEMTREVMKSLSDKDLNTRLNKFTNMKPKNEQADLKKTKLIDKITVEMKHRKDVKNGVTDDNKTAKKKSGVVSAKQLKNNNDAETLKDIMPPTIDDEIKTLGHSVKADIAEQEKAKGTELSEQERVGIARKHLVTSKRGLNMLSKYALSGTYFISEMCEKLSENSEYANMEGLTDDYKNQEDDIKECWDDILYEWRHVISKFVTPSVELTAILTTTAAGRYSRNNSKSVGKMLGATYDKYQRSKQEIIKGVTKNAKEYDERQASKKHDEVDPYCNPDGSLKNL